MRVCIIDKWGRVRYLGKHTRFPWTVNDWWAWMSHKTLAYEFKDKVELVKTVREILLDNVYLCDMWTNRQLDTYEGTWEG